MNNLFIREREVQNEWKWIGTKSIPSNAPISLYNEKVYNVQYIPLNGCISIQIKEPMNSVP